MTDEPELPMENPEWVNRAIGILNAKVPSAGNCPACGIAGVGKVIAGKHLVTPVMTDVNGGVSIGGPIYPFVMLICTNCGNTRFFNYAIITQQDAPNEPKA